MSEERKDPTAEENQQAADAAAAERGVSYPDPQTEEEEDPGDQDFPVEGK